MNRRLILGISVSALVVALIIIIALLLSGDKFSLSFRTVTVSGDAATYTMELDLNAEWVLIATPGDWCYVDPYMGNKGRSRITVKAAANPHQEMREAKLTFYSGNVTKDFVLKQLPGSQRSIAVAPKLVVTKPVKPVSPSRPVAAVKPKQVPVTKKSQSKTVVKPKQAPAVKPKPVKQDDVSATGKIIIQDGILQEAEPAKKETPVKKEPVRPAPSPMFERPCTPVESFLLTSTSNFICNGQPVVFSLSNSQPSISYQLYRDGKSVSGYVPGKGGEITFPGSFKEVGVYTAKSVAVADYCATDMKGSIALIVAEKFNPGKIDSYNVIMKKGDIPPLIKSLIPAHGGGNIHYRWAVNGRLIEGAHGETYQPAEVAYGCTYTRMAHDESCNVPWEHSAGEAVVTMERK